MTTNKLTGVPGTQISKCDHCARPLSEKDSTACEGCEAVICYSCNFSDDPRESICPSCYKAEGGFNAT